MQSLADGRLLAHPTYLVEGPGGRRTRDVVQRDALFERLSSVAARVPGGSGDS